MRWRKASGISMGIDGSLIFLGICRGISVCKDAICRVERDESKLNLGSRSQSLIPGFGSKHERVNGNDGNGL